MSAKCIFRISKLKTWAEIGGAASHNLRTRPTPNADPSIKNITVHGAKSAEQVISDAKEKLDHIRVRSNAVLAVEVLLTASPTYFRENEFDHGAYDEEKLQAWRDATEPFIRENFPHAVSVVLHLDEATPHYQIIDIPIRTTKDGQNRLDARTKYGGAAKLSQWQDRAAAAVEHLGIERGVRGSTATHTTLKDFYSALNAAGVAIPKAKPRPKKIKALPPRTAAQLIPMTDAHDKRKKQEQAHAERIAQYKKDLKEHQDSLKQQRDYTLKIATTSNATALENERLKKENERLKALYAHDKAIADQMRRLPVKDVLQRIYGASCTNNVCTISRLIKVTVTEKVGGDLWYIEGQEKGGRGAMNLLMAISNDEYQVAIAKLALEFGTDTTIQEVSGDIMERHTEQRAKVVYDSLSEYKTHLKIKEQERINKEKAAEQARLEKETAEQRLLEQEQRQHEYDLVPESVENAPPPQTYPSPKM